MKNFLVFLSLCGLAVATVSQAETAADKSRYHLFNPVPKDEMRELSTDRPDKTESAYTVDAGHFQAEVDIVSFTYDQHNPDRDRTRVESFDFFAMNLKAGLLNNVDLQTVIETYKAERTRDLRADTEDHRDGFGDITQRVKVNLWGNDGGKTALALMPFVKWPTSQHGLGNDAIEGGLIVPLAVELPAGWGMGVMAEFDCNRDEADSGHHFEFIQSITFSHNIVGNLGGYIEFFSALSEESGSDWVGSVDAGLTYALGDNVQLDAGANVGVTRAADDINPFIGISVRY